MERRYGYRDGLSDEALRAIDYEADQMDKGQFRLGQYEPDYTVEGVLMRGSYEIGDRHMRIYDAVWGEAYIGDEEYDPLLIELARTPLFRRLQSIEQLTLGKDHATMPNSMCFSRWEHIWGSVVFVRKMLAGRDDISARQKMVLQLRTLLSDVGHTAFSHLGDWMFQGPNGGEDMHDKDLKDILHASGIQAILERYGFSVDETVFPDIEDWVECRAPGLCVDRIDYGMREILRWVAPSIPMNMHLRKLHNPQEVFEIDTNGQLVFKDLEMAKLYAAGFSILPTEHWLHPVHRLQLQLFQSGVRSALIDKVEDDNMHPREALYGIENDFYAHFQTWPMLHLQSVMKAIGMTQRRIFMHGRRNDLNHIFANIEDEDWQFPNFPEPLQPYTWQTEFFGKPYPPNVILEAVETGADSQWEWNDRGLTITLPKLKPRAVDPPVKLSQFSGAPEGTVKTLTEIMPSYLPYMEGQRRAMGTCYRATILMRPDIARMIVEEHQKAERLWPALLKRSRDPDNLRQVIEDVEPYAAVHSFDAIREVWDDQIDTIRKLGEQGVLFGL